MTDITAKVIADSVSPQGKRITTLQLRYPRFIHSEFMTHRMFSRNASSSRAIPVEKEVEQVINNPALPIHIGKNQKGMQARDELTKAEASRVSSHLETLGKLMAKDIKLLSENYGVHKQVLNRYLEPWLHIDVVVTATEWDNFFNLRDHEAAQPEIRELAKQMREAINNSSTVLKDNWAYHLPYFTDELIELPFNDRVLVCVARCARVSYRNHDGTFDVEKDLSLALNLYKSGHWSPFEHIAHPADSGIFYANFNGWRSLRNLIEGNLYIVEKEEELTEA